MDPLSLLVGAGIFLGGTGFGRLLRRRSQPSSVKQPKPICGCGHHVSMHDKKTDVCHATIKQAVKWDSYGDAKSFEHVQCACRHYVGPKALDSFFMPPMLLEE